MIGLGIVAFGIWLFYDAMNFTCDDTRLSAAASCAAPDNGIAKIIGGVLIGAIGGILYGFSRVIRPVVAK